MMHSTSLRSSSISAQPEDHTSESELAHSSTAAISQPIAMAPKTPAKNNQDPIDARSQTPTSTAQFALAAGVLSVEGPGTPRNDAGPFVLDGSAGRGRDGDEAARAWAWAWGSVVL